ncbi:MAG TPA: hypothetical protein VKX49_12690 [Bryobacteraceae bacterium]|nr:hypothetical protein [Bryobacteraceae bacterium]
MKHILKLIAGLSLAAASLFGQAAMTSTTLSTAVPLSQRGFNTTVFVASATGITAPSVSTPQGGVGSPTGGPNLTVLFVDKELMRVNAVSGTTITVERGYSGTPVMAHNSGATVWVGTPSQFYNIDPFGACTASAVPVLPRVVYTTGNVWNCGSNGQWFAWTYFNTAPQVGTAIASAATIAPTTPVVHVTGTTTINTITVPSGFPKGGTLILIPDGLWSTGTSGNIAIATTGVVSKALLEVWDGTKFYPSY